MAAFVIDSWAWIEYFFGTSRGMKIKELIENKSSIYCTTISIAEVTSKLKRQGYDAQNGRQTIIANSQIIPLDENDAYEAGQIHAEMRKTIADFGMADAIVLAAARKIKAKVVTGDPHFSGIKDAVMI